LWQSAGEPIRQFAEGAQEQLVRGDVMNTSSPKPAQTPVANNPTRTNPIAVEDDIAKLKFSGTQTASGTKSEVLQSYERKPDEKESAAIEGCMRTGDLMKVLFPAGLQLKTEEDFAVFRLFDRLVGDIAHFARTGMKGQAALRGISTHARLLENVITSKDGS
jgi:hypothetical protein